MSYRTVPCKFYKENKCKKGNNCTFIHETESKSIVKYKIDIPLSAIKNETELLKNIKVYTWVSYPRKVNYEIYGNTQFDVWSYFNIIKEVYPENPYFTKHYPIVIYDISEFNKKYKLLVTRSSTSS